MLRVFNIPVRIYTLFLKFGKRKYFKILILFCFHQGNTHCARMILINCRSKVDMIRNMLAAVLLFSGFVSSVLASGDYMVIL